MSEIFWRWNKHEVEVIIGRKSVNQVEGELMAQLDIFVSVGGTANERQEKFVQAVEERLRSEGLVPHTVGRNTFSAGAPLKTVTDLID